MRLGSAAGIGDDGAVRRTRDAHRSLTMSSASRLVLALCLLPAPVARAAEGPVAERARAVLERHCYRCHGQAGTARGGFGYLLDHARLLDQKKIVPGRPDE